MALATRTGTSATSDSNSIVITKPTGVGANERIYVWIALRSSSTTPTVTPPAGWVTVRDSGNFTGGKEHRAVLCSLLTGGSEPANYTFNFSGTPSARTVALCTSVYDTAGVPTTDVSSIVTDTVENTSVTANGVTTNFDNELLLFFGSASRGFSSPKSYTPPSGMTEEIEHESASNPDGGSSCEIASIAFSTKGATGNKTATLSATSAAKVGSLVGVYTVNNNSGNFFHFLQ